MMKYAEYGDDFYKICQKEKRKIVVYGAGNGLKECLKKVSDISYICDKNAKNIKKYQEIDVYEPDVLKEEIAPIYIIVSVRDARIYQEICREIEEYVMDATVFHFFNNVAFNYNFWNTMNDYLVSDTVKPLRINIVCQEEAWIFAKFASRMADVLEENHIDVTISTDTIKGVDINHHIPYIAYTPYPNDTVMITHVDNMKKIHLLKKQLEIARMGICMSKDTMNQLIMSGIPRDRLCYINPAHDHVIRPHKYLIGITHKCHDKEDLRKRATELIEVLEDVNPLYFRFFIMGAGWDDVVSIIREKGFEIDYYPEFEYDKYNLWMQKIDYFLYMGFDEGNMGYLDALAAGAGTIVTPQGYHLDTDCPIDYPCCTVSQFRDAFLDLQNKREKRVKAVSDWTWNNYVLKHLEIWNYILRRKTLSELYRHQSCYLDGIFSTMVEDNRL